MFFGVASTSATTSTGALLEAVIEARLEAKDWGFQMFCSSVIAKDLCRQLRRNVPRIGWTALGSRTTSPKSEWLFL